MKLTEKDIKDSLDVALLAPTATSAEIEELARIIKEENFSYFCVHVYNTKRAASLLDDSPAKVITCVAFPHGASSTEAKVFETEVAISAGAGEIDMVLNLGAFLSGDISYAGNDISAVVKAAGVAPVKVIIETPYLTMQQKIDASHLVQDSGAAFVKTCTGCCPDPVCLYEDIRLIRQTVGPKMGIKASGRVGNYFRYVSMLEAGATRVGLVLPQAREILRGWQDSDDQ